MNTAFQNVNAPPADYEPTTDDWEDFARWVSRDLEPSVIPMPGSDPHDRAVNRIVRLTNGSRAEVQAIVADLAEAIGRQIVAELQHEGMIGR